MEILVVSRTSVVDEEGRGCCMRREDGVVSFAAKGEHGFGEGMRELQDLRTIAHSTAADESAFEQV